MPEDDPPLDLGAEPGVARGGHDLLGARVAVGHHPQPVAHRVELGEVARRLAREDEVVRRERVVEARAVDLDDLGAEVDEQLNRLVEPLAHPRLVPLAAELANHADGHALDRRPLRRVDHRRHRRVDRGGVHRVVAADECVEQRGVQHRTGARSGLVEARGQRHEAVAGDAAVGRLDPDRPVTAAGWRIEPPVSVPIASGAWNDATALDDPPPDPPGIRVRSHGLWLGPQAECSVDEPMANSSMLVLPRIGMAAVRRWRHERRVVRRYPALEDPAAARRRQPAVAMTSLTAIGTPASRCRLSPATRRWSTSSRCAARPRRRRAGTSGRRRRLGRAVEVRSGQLDGADLLRGQQARHLGGAEPGEVGGHVCSQPS